MTGAIQSRHVDAAIATTVHGALSSTVQAQAGDETFAALLGEGSEAVAQQLPALQEALGFASSADVAAVQGWSMADLLGSVELEEVVAEAMLRPLKERVAAAGQQWDPSMELRFVQALVARGGAQLVEALLADVPLHAIVGDLVDVALAGLDVSSVGEEPGAGFNGGLAQGEEERGVQDAAPRTLSGALTTPAYVDPACISSRGCQRCRWWCCCSPCQVHLPRKTD